MARVWPPTCSVRRRRRCSRSPTACAPVAGSGGPCSRWRPGPCSRRLVIPRRSRGAPGSVPSPPSAARSSRPSSAGAGASPGIVRPGSEASPRATLSTEPQCRPEHAMAGDWVLVTEGGDGQSRAAVAAVRALAADGYRPAVTEYDGLSLAGASRHCARRVPVPLGEVDPEGYAKAVRVELESRQYLAVFPGTDAALVALDAPVQHLINKESSARLAVAAGLPVPPSHVFDRAEELLGAAGTLEYPIVVKPVVKRYAAVRVDSARELEGVAAQRGAMMVQPYLHDNMRGVVGLMWQGELVAATHFQYLRVWPAPCGTIASGTTVLPDAQLEARLEKLLADYDGVFHVDLAGPYLLDVNPRTHASLPVAVIAGANVVSLYC